jgi:hypothetical protein
MLGNEEIRNLIAEGAVQLFLCLFCLLKLEVNFFQCVAVQPNSMHLRNQEPHRRGRSKALSVPFLSFEAGSDLLPVRSGAAKFDALKAISVECKSMKKPGTSSQGAQ